MTRRHTPEKEERKRSEKDAGNRETIPNYRSQKGKQPDASICCRFLTRAGPA
jgi:hypothetical protein